MAGIQRPVYKGSVIYQEKLGMKCKIIKSKGGACDVKFENGHIRKNVDKSAVLNGKLTSIY